MQAHNDLFKDSLQRESEKIEKKAHSEGRKKFGAGFT